MYARNVSLHLKANTAGEFTRTFEKDVLPLLRKQNGFKDEISFVAPRTAPKRLRSVCGIGKRARTTTAATSIRRC